MKVNDKLYQEIKAISNKIKGWYNLSKEDQEDVITETWIKLFSKDKEGVIQLKNGYENYKGYLFLVTRNFIFKALNKLTVKNKRDEEINYSQTYKNQYYMLDTPEVKKIIREIPQPYRAILRWQIRGWTKTYILKNSNFKQHQYLIPTFYSIKNFNKKIKDIL